MIKLRVYTRETLAAAAAATLIVGGSVRLAGGTWSIPAQDVRAVRDALQRIGYGTPGLERAALELRRKLLGAIS